MPVLPPFLSDIFAPRYAASVRQTPRDPEHARQIAALDARLTVVEETIALYRRELTMHARAEQGRRRERDGE